MRAALTPKTASPLFPLPQAPRSQKPRLKMNKIGSFVELKPSVLLVCVQVHDWLIDGHHPTTAGPTGARPPRRGFQGPFWQARPWPGQEAVSSGEGRCGLRTSIFELIKSNCLRMVIRTMFSAIDGKCVNQRGQQACTQPLDVARALGSLCHVPCITCHFLYIFSLYLRSQLMYRRLVNEEPSCKSVKVQL